MHTTTRRCAVMATANVGSPALPAAPTTGDTP